MEKQLPVIERIGSGVGEVEFFDGQVAFINSFRKFIDLVEPFALSLFLLLPSEFISLATCDRIQETIDPVLVQLFDEIADIRVGVDVETVTLKTILYDVRPEIN